MGPSVPTFHGLKSQPLCPTLQPSCSTHLSASPQSFSDCSQSLSFLTSIDPGGIHASKPYGNLAPVSGTEVAQLQSAAEAFPGHSIHPQNSR